MSGKSQRIMIRNARCVFPKLYTAEEYMNKKNFSIGLLINADSENLATIEKAIRAAVEAAYPGDADKMLKRFKKSNQTWPLKELEDGGYSITPKRKEEQGAPTVLDQKKHNIPADAGKPYAGCYVNCSIDVFCYTKNGGGVTSYLNGVQFAKDGEPLGAGATAASCRDEFDELEAPEAPQSDDDLM